VTQWHPWACMYSSIRTHTSMRTHWVLHGADEPEVSAVSKKVMGIRVWVEGGIKRESWIQTVPAPQ
jgi:hypothetical protein